MSISLRYPLLKNRRTKIVVTLGPASAEPDTIRRLIEAGANVFRLNLSHGSHAAHRAAAEEVRRAAAAADIPVALLADLCGPKIRAGCFENGAIQLETGTQVTVTTRRVTGRPGLIPCRYQGLIADLHRGDRLILKDGLLELEVMERDGTEAHCTVLRGGELSDHNGIHLPGRGISAGAFTDKDRQDAAFAVELGVEFMALSFVRNAADVEALRAFLRGGAGAGIRIIAKIERAEAIENAAAILDAADGVMVARGDLGIDLPPEQVPIVQRELILQARLCCKPAIVATQMLESMTESRRPTRAEVTDVAHAVENDTDAVMLSGETAAGRYPVETVLMMNRILRQAEAYNYAQGLSAIPLPRRTHDAPRRIGVAIAQSAATLARELTARALVVLSRGGMSAATICAVRPDAPVVVLTGDPRTRNAMALHWGALPILMQEAHKEHPNQLARRVARRLELAGDGDFILLVRGFAAQPDMNTPSLTALQT